MKRFGELLARAKTGDEDAIAELYERYGAAISAAIRSRMSPLLRKHYDTLDLWQSVFAEVLRDLPRFEDRGERAFQNWLVLKGRVKVASKLRKHVGTNGRRVERGLETAAAEFVGDARSDPTERVALREEDEALRRALDGLGEPDRSLVRLRGEEDLPFADIAARLGLAGADAARKRYARALLALRRTAGG